jgi:hypothetical protein
MTQAPGQQMSDSGRQEPEPEKEPFEAYAWRVNQALHDWTSKVDAKASVILTLETAILSMIVVFVRTGKRLDQLTPLESWTFKGGVVMLVCAIILAGSAVFPQLNRRDAQRNWRSNYVYFGHLRRWEPLGLIQALEGGTPEKKKEVISTQLIALSKIIWRKHSFLQCSMILVAAGNAVIWASLLLS